MHVYDWENEKQVIVDEFQGFFSLSRVLCCWFTVFYVCVFVCMHVCVAVCVFCIYVCVCVSCVCLSGRGVSICVPERAGTYMRV